MLCSMILRNSTFTFTHFQLHAPRKTCGVVGECGKRNCCLGFLNFNVFTVSKRDSTFFRWFCVAQWPIMFLVILGIIMIEQYWLEVHEDFAFNNFEDKFSVALLLKVLTFQYNYIQLYLKPNINININLM